MIEECKRQARRIKRDHPDKSYCQRLDVAAKAMGFESFKDLKATVGGIRSDNSDSEQPN